MEPRTLRLKGYDRPVRAVEVVPADRVPRRISRMVTRIGHRLRSDRRSAAVIAGILAIAVAATLAAVVLRGGRSSLADLPAGGRQMVPSAGPYYIADRLNGEDAILLPNPNYPWPRRRELDAIALREGVDVGGAVQRIEEEGWHGVMNAFDPRLEPGGALYARWGPESAAAKEGDQRFLESRI